jgi:hypothetical protein
MAPFGPFGIMQGKHPAKAMQMPNEFSASRVPPEPAVFPGAEQREGAASRALNALTSPSMKM